MAFERLKARLGMGGRQRRYVDIDSIRDLNDVSDPESFDDESQQSLREWAGKHPVLTVVLTLVVVLVGGVLVFWSSRIAPQVLTNPWTLRAGAGILLFGLGYRAGWSNRGERHFGWDELNLKLNGKAVALKGTYLDDLPGEADGFIPIKGWRRGAHVAKPYTNADLGAAMVESHRAFLMDDDDAAVIRLQPTETEVTHTDWGTRVVCEAGELAPDPDGNHTTLVATYPDYDDDRANKLADQLETVTKDYYDVIEENQGLETRVKDLKDRLTSPIEEEVDKRIDQFAKMRDAVDGRRRDRTTSEDGVGPRPHMDYRGTGSMSPSANKEAQRELEEVEEEVSTDD